MRIRLSTLVISLKISQLQTLYEKQGTDFEAYINSKNKNTKEIRQNELKENIANWNFLKQSNQFINMIKEYNKQENIQIYYDHKLANNLFHSHFYFDGGYNIDEKQRLQTKEFYEYPKMNNNFYNIKENKGYWKNIRNDKKHKNYIGLCQGNQEYLFLDSKYKVIWTYANSKRFFFTNKPLIWARNQFRGIGGNNKNEILYLFALLNSSLNIFILKKFLKSENEKDFLLSSSSIKNFIKVPKITDKNKSIKQEIIKQTEKLLALEDLQLKDFVDFTTTIQKFEQLEVQGDNLILTNSQNNKVQQKINSKTELIKDLIEETYNQKPLQEISLHDLKYTPAIDKQEQAVIKDYIDDLVFALYFIIPIKKIGIEQAQNIKTQCLKNQYYQYIH